MTFSPIFQSNHYAAYFLQTFFIHLKLESLMQLPAPNDDLFLFLGTNIHVENVHNYYIIMQKNK